MEIVLIGTGNTATVLGRKLKEAGHVITQIYGRDAAAASELAYILDSESTNYWSVVNRNADIYIIAVSDIAIEEVVQQLHLPEKTIVHTAASVPIHILKRSSQQHGVFYPLQTLKKESVHLPDTPIIIDASTKQTLHQLEQLGESISNNVVIANDGERAKLHLAAVFCNNFVNHVYTLMEDYCKNENLDFTLLQPLILETAQRVLTMSPQAAQTGPAQRHDSATIETHLQLLQQHPRLKDFYNLFTKSIGQPL